MKRRSVSLSLPHDIAEIAEERAQELPYNSTSGYILGLIIEDLWKNKHHGLIPSIINGSRKNRDALFKEIVANYRQPEKTGGYFEHMLERLAGELLKKRIPECPGTCEVAQALKTSDCSNAAAGGCRS